jgi:hypothetical protein
MVKLSFLDRYIIIIIIKLNKKISSPAKGLWHYLKFKLNKN